MADAPEFGITEAKEAIEDLVDKYGLGMDFAGWNMLKERIVKDVKRRFDITDLLGEFLGTKDYSPAACILCHKIYALLKE